MSGHTTDRSIRDEPNVSKVIADITVVIGGITLLVGAWAFFSPAGFFEDFPISGAEWVSRLGDYNEHLMRDFGSAEIGLGLAAVVAGVRRSRESIVAVLSGFVVFGTLHFGYHTGTFGVFSTISAASQAASLVAFILIPMLLLWGIRSRRD